jgi:hypothetical protein
MAQAPPGAAHARACVKHRYPNQGVALKVLREIQRLNLPKNKQQRAYWCGDCGGWHLTSQPLRVQVDLTDADRQADWWELKVYETPDVARAAAFVAIEVPDVGGTVAITDLVERWRRRYPRHDEPTAKRSGRARLLRAARALDHIGIVLLAEDDERVTVLDIDGLHMIAGNLDVFEDRNGVARRPSRWPRTPEAPAHLRDLQASLIAAGVVGWKRVGKGLAPPLGNRLSTVDVAGAAATKRSRGRLRRILHWLGAIAGRPRNTRTDHISEESS